MFFNCRNGQGHLVRYLQHRFFMDAAQNEDAAALYRQRIDYGLHLAQRLAGMQLRLYIILALQ